MPDLTGEDLYNVWMLVEGFRTDYEIIDVEPEPFEEITNCPHWEEVAKAMTTIAVGNEYSDFTEPEKESLEGVIVCQEKVAYMCVESMACYEADPLTWKRMLLLEELDASFSPWQEIRAWGDNTEETETQ